MAFCSLMMRLVLRMKSSGVQEKSQVSQVSSVSSIIELVLMRIEKQCREALEFGLDHGLWESLWVGLEELDDEVKCLPADLQNCRRSFWLVLNSGNSSAPSRRITDALILARLIGSSPTLPN
jgi:hypothetical protein